MFSRLKGGESWCGSVGCVGTFLSSGWMVFWGFRMAKTSVGNKVAWVCAEAASAAKRKGPSAKRLVEILNGHEIKSSPESWEARWLAARALESLGYTFKRSQ